MPWAPIQKTAGDPYYPGSPAGQAEFGPNAFVISTMSFQNLIWHESNMVGHLPAHGCMTEGLPTGGLVHTHGHVAWQLGPRISTVP